MKKRRIFNIASALVFLLTMALIISAFILLKVESKDAVGHEWMSYAFWAGTLIVFSPVAFIVEICMYFIFKPLVEKDDEC